jgi:hypothetical protein
LNESDASFVIQRKPNIRKNLQSTTPSPVRNKKKLKSVESDIEISELKVATLKTKRTRSIRKDDVMVAIDEMRNEMSELKKENQVCI